MLQEVLFKLTEILEIRYFERPTAQMFEGGKIERW